MLKPLSRFLLLSTIFFFTLGVAASFFWATGYLLLTVICCIYCLSIAPMLGSEAKKITQK